jgi:hypothetical protein
MCFKPSNAKAFSQGEISMDIFGMYSKNITCVEKYLTLWLTYKKSKLNFESKDVTIILN